MTRPAENVKIGRLCAEYGGTPLVGTPTPRLSWTIDAVEGWLQARYELRSDREALLIESDESLFVPWPFEPLTSREETSVQVRVTSVDGRSSDWSEPLVIVAGLFDVSDWQASFAGHPWELDPQVHGPCPFLRREFEVDRPVTSARLYSTALGVYEMYLNGAIVGDEVLSPNWTSYEHRLRYQSFDVTDRLQMGRNALGAILGDGWYRGRISEAGTGRSPYGNRLALLAQLEITFCDGMTDVIVSDSQWRAASGPIIASDIYDGERYDARLEFAGWSEADYDDHTWQQAVVVDHPLETLVAPTDPPIRRVEELAVSNVFQSPSGKLILDFGQNVVGRLRIAVSGESGDTLTIRHGEMLQDGELYRDNLSGAASVSGALAEDTYTLKGGEPETWEPRFTFHGFRYAQIDGWPGRFSESSVHAIVLHTDFQRIGWFECSNPLVNKLHESMLWSLRGNFLGLLTDCPQRGERLGWTAEAQLSTPPACSLFDVNGSLVSWLADLAAEQTPDGRVPYVVPNVIRLPRPRLATEEELRLDGLFLTTSAGWGDAAVIVPWVVYQRFGDVGVLKKQWDSMRGWVDYVEQLAGASRIWDTGFQHGDWLDPWAPSDRPYRGQTPPDVFATAYFARSAELVARTAEVLGFEDEAEHYAALAADIRSAFCRSFLDSAGNLDAPSTTAQALLLAFSLSENEGHRLRAGERLSQLVAATGFRASTGTTGTAIVCDALCEAGDLESAYRLLLQTEFPSWLYMVANGATTIWERWDALLPDGRVNPQPMNSFNHPVFGSVIDWLHRTVAGLESREPGYRKIRFCPRPGGDLSYASARHLTPYGMAAISWHWDRCQLDVEVVVPGNTQAEIVLPDGTEPFVIQSGVHRWSIGLRRQSAS